MGATWKGLGKTPLGSKVLATVALARSLPQSRGLCGSRTGLRMHPVGQEDQAANSTQFTGPPGALCSRGFQGQI